MSEPRGMFRRETLPSLQLPLPEALVVTRLTTHVLVAGLFGFGIGSGGPKRHPGLPGYSGLGTPAAVQLRLLPVSVALGALKLIAPVPAAQLAMFVNGVAPPGITGAGTPAAAPPAEVEAAAPEVQEVGTRVVYDGTAVAPRRRQAGREGEASGARAAATARSRAGRGDQGTGRCRLRDTGRRGTWNGGGRGL